MRIFPVRLPSGERYWTVVDARLVVVPAADRFLREERFGRDRAELTTKAHAGGVALFLRWCDRTGRDWRSAARDLGLFIARLKFTPADPDGDGVAVAGPGAQPVRQARRINRVLTAVRLFLSSAVRHKDVEPWVLGLLYEVADARDLPVEAQGEDTSLVYRMAARHRLAEEDRPADRATDAEILELLRACRSARDRLLVLLMARVGLRRGEVCGLRREDLHLLADSRNLGCAVEGSHLHVVRRANVNGAWAKSRRGRAGADSGPLSAQAGKRTQAVSSAHANPDGQRGLSTTTLRGWHRDWLLQLPAVTVGKETTVDGRAVAVQQPFDWAAVTVYAYRPATHSAMPTPEYRLMSYAS